MIPFQTDALAKAWRNARARAAARRPADTQAGMSLMEILLVIAIVAFLIVGGLTLFVQAQSQGQAQRAQQQLGNLAASIRSLYAGQSTYTTLTVPQLYNTNSVPEDMQDPDNNIYNSFGGQVAVQPGSACGGTNGDFCITFPNLPQEACQQLATARIGYVGVAQGNSAPQDNAPLPVDQVGTVCPQGQARTTVTFRFSG